MSLLIKIKRYHFILLGGFFMILGGIGIVSYAYRTDLESPSLLEMERSIDQKKDIQNDLNEKVFPPVLPLKSSSGLIALTFDDGPHPHYTEEILKILKEKNVPATFFVVGKQVEKYPNLLEKICLGSHEIANHSYSHPDLRKLTPKTLGEELLKNHQIVKSVTGIEMKYYRPPGGQYNQEVMRLGNELDYKLALWSVFTGDHKNPSPQIIRQRVFHGISSGGVVLLHSGVKNTVKALPDLIDDLKKEGYGFGTLTQIELAHSNSTSILNFARNNKK